MKNIFLITGILFFLMIISCNKCNNKDTEQLKINVAKIDVANVKIHRYEKSLANVNPKTLARDLKALLPEFKFFLESDLNDINNIQQIKFFITDPLFNELYNDGMKIYPDLSDIEKELTAAFKHCKYYFLNSKVPEVYSYISIFDFEQPIKFNDDSVLIIALDMYYGSKYKSYSCLKLPDGKIGIPSFKMYQYKKEFIVPDCMQEMAKSKIDYNKSCKSFLEEMIYQGKILYFKDAMLPDVDDTIKIAYPSKKLDWCKKNEHNIWAFFIDTKLLYSADQHKYNKFLTEGPFTSAFSKESPARIGAWIGWQIVRKYMNKNKNVSIAQLLENYDAQQILSMSGYKPKK